MAAKRDLGANDHAAPASVPIGARIRAVRRRKKYTLERLASAAEMDKGFLSRLERGEKSASIGTIQNIARALGQSVASLLGETHDPLEVRIVRASRRRDLAHGISENGHQLAALTLGEQSEPFSAYVVEVGAQTGRIVAHHAGQELMYVLHGRVLVRFQHREETLKAGDSAVFPGYLPHRIERQGRAKAQVLIVVGGA